MNVKNKTLLLKQMLVEFFYLLKMYEVNCTCGVFDPSVVYFAVAQFCVKFLFSFKYELLTIT